MRFFIESIKLFNISIAPNQAFHYLLLLSKTLVKFVCELAQAFPKIRGFSIGLCGHIQSKQNFKGPGLQARAQVRSSSIFNNVLGKSLPRFIFSVKSEKGEMIGETVCLKMRNTPHGRQIDRLTNQLRAGKSNFLSFT